MKIHIHFCSNKKWWAKLSNFLIKRVDNVGYSHVAIEMETITQKRIYESVFPVSKVTPKEEWLKTYEVKKTYSWTVPPHLQFKVYQWLESKLGIIYSIPQIVLLGIVGITKPLSKISGRLSVDKEQALICTEYGARFIGRFMNIKIKESYDMIGVKDMVEYCEELKDDPKWSDA